MMIKLQIVNSIDDKKIVKDIISKYHSYVPGTASVGRKIDWLIYHDNKIIGMIGIGSSVYPPPKDILTYTNLSKDEYRVLFNSFSSNWRFCMKESILNAGTRTLKQLRQLAPIEWKNKYGNVLKYIITFVGGGNTGAVYKADNWRLIGKTAGLPKHKSSSMKWDSNEKLKEKFVKPTGENRKLIFIKEVG